MAPDRRAWQYPIGLGGPGSEPESQLPVVLTVDDADSPRDVIDALARTPFVAGKQPYATTMDLDTADGRRSGVDRLAPHVTNE